MKYERLTEKDIRADKLVEEILDSSANEQLSLYKRLQGLEDKIENGTLIELPCKVGDLIYEVVPNCYLNTWKVDNLSLTSRYEQFVIDVTSMDRTCSHWRFWQTNFGKTLFTNKEKAEEKLKELQK